MSHSFFVRFFHAAGHLLRSHLMAVFFVLLAAILTLALVGGAAQEMQSEDKESSAKSVRVFRATDDDISVSDQARVEKDGSVTVRALSPGVVSRIAAKEGDTIRKGQTIIALSDTYGSRSAADIRQNMAEAEYDAALRVRDLEKSILKKQDDLISKIDGDTQTEIERKQLKVEKRQSELREAESILNRDLAAAMRSALYPRSPFSGRLERVFVRAGENVSAGDALFTVGGGAGGATIEALVSADVARAVSIDKSSAAYIGEDAVSVFPVFISREATQYSLYSVLFSLPDEYRDRVSDNSFIEMDIALENPFVSGGAESVLVPIEAVALSQSGAFVFVMEGDTARSHGVKLGSVIGNAVEVFDGVSADDAIILDRTVVDGDTVREES